MSIILKAPSHDSYTFPSTSLLDTFSYTNGALATTGSANWETYFGLDFTVSNGTIFPGNGAGGIITYKGISAQKVEVYIAISQLPGSTQKGVVIWMDASGNGYAVEYVHGSPGSIRICTLASYATTLLGSAISATLSNNDLLGMSVDGTTNTIKAFTSISGTWSEQGSRTDSTYTTARKIGIASTGTTVGISDFYGGSI